MFNELDVDIEDKVYDKQEIERFDRKFLNDLSRDDKVLFKKMSDHAKTLLIKWRICDVYEDRIKNELRLVDSEELQETKARYGYLARKYRNEFWYQVEKESKLYDTTMSVKRGFVVVESNDDEFHRFMRRVIA